MKASIAVSEQQVLKVLIYGDSGTGKTTWGALCPEPMILLTEPQGRQAIAAANPEAEIVFVRDYEHFYALLGEIQHARFVAGRGKVSVTNDKGESEVIVFGSIIIDSLSDLHGMMVDHYKADEPGQRDSMQRWGQVQNTMKGVLGELRGLPTNVVALCLACETGGEGEPRRTLPDLYGGMKGKAAQFFNAVGYSVKKPGGHAVAWDIKSPAYISKRPPGSQGVIPDLTYTVIGTPSGTLGSILLAIYGETAPHNASDSAAGVNFEPAKETK